VENILSIGIQKQKRLLSDIEGNHKDVLKEAFYHMTYPLADGSGSVENAKHVRKQCLVTCSGGSS